MRNLSAGREVITPRMEKSVSPMVQEKILQFSGKNDEEETKKRDSERSPGQTPPGKEIKETRIPGLNYSKKSKGKGRSPASKHASF